MKSLIHAALTFSILAITLSSTPKISEASDRLQTSQAWEFIQFVMELDLEQRQKTHIANTLKRYTPALEAHLMQAIGARTRLQELSMQSSPDELSVRQTVRELSSALEELAVLRIVIRQEIQPILSIEQRTTIDSFIESRKELQVQRIDRLTAIAKYWIERHSEDTPEG